MSSVVLSVSAWPCVAGLVDLSLYRLTVLPASAGLIIRWDSYSTSLILASQLATS